MTLSIEQLQAIESGQAIELVIEGTPCVVVRQDVYDQERRYSPGSPRELYPLVLKALDQFDESPDQYLEYLND